MNGILDLVIICKRKETKDTISYIPVSAEIGVYDDKNEIFTTNDGKKYQHVIMGEEMAFLGRISLADYLESFNKASEKTTKNNFLKQARHNKYILAEKEDDKVPVILQTDKRDNNLYLDDDLITFYNKYYPKSEINKFIINRKINVSDEEMNINDVYKELTSKIIGQDDPIKQILSTIWKQYNNNDRPTNYNILINGPAGVGKTTIFKLLEELLGIPCIIVTAKRLREDGYLENLLLKLMEKTDFDVEKAETAIVVVDKLEEISTNSRERHNTISKSLQEIIINLIDEGTFTINTINNEKYRFSMNKLLIVGIGNFNNNENLRNTPIGFNAENRGHTMSTYGIIPELANKFPIVIEMNALTMEDYISIIRNSMLSSLNINREFLGKRNIDLVVNDDVINYIAKLAYDRKLGAKSINEIIETSLALAEFEIASNPSLYDSLVLSKDTITDNKKYVLTKRKND